jgi:RHS repeat-associated protein
VNIGDIQPINAFGLNVTQECECGCNTCPQTQPVDYRKSSDVQRANSDSSGNFEPPRTLLMRDGGPYVPPDLPIMRYGPGDESGSAANAPILLGASNSGGVPPGWTGRPVRYFDGVLKYVEADLWSEGFGGSLGISRMWSNKPNYSATGLFGSGWSDGFQPFLLATPDQAIMAVVLNGTTALYFDKNPFTGEYQPRQFVEDRLVKIADHFELITPSNSRIVFTSLIPQGPDKLIGRFQSTIDVNGATTSVVSRNGSSLPTEIQRSFQDGSTLITESLQFTYGATGSTTEARVVNAALRRQVGAGSPWDIVRQVDYTYYATGSAIGNFTSFAIGSANGNVGDLRTATTKNATGQTLETEYYRYWSSGGLKYALRTESLRRATSANGSDLDAIPDAALAVYADHYFEYDSELRVTKEVAGGAGCSACSGGLGEFTLSYTPNSVEPNTLNDWVMKTVETLPDGSSNTVYTNVIGATILKVFHDAITGLNTSTFHTYDQDGRRIMTASPSAILGWDDKYSDLLHNVNGNYEFLSDTVGVIETVNWYYTTSATTTQQGAAAGRYQGSSIRRGELGTPVPQSQLGYVANTANGATQFEASGVTVYQNVNGTGAITWSTNYDWNPTTAVLRSVTSLNPSIGSAQNSSGASANTTVVFDTLGRAIWSKDAAGFLTYTQYDTGTGSPIKIIEDVNTTLTADFVNLPSGWTTPSNGGLHRITRSEVDSLGRATKVTSPAGVIDYTVYNDVTREVRLYSGWNSTTNSPTGPTIVSRTDASGTYSETLTMSATPTVVNGRPTGAEPITNLQSLSRTFYNDVGQTVAQHDYFNLVGVIYSVTPLLGTLGVNYYRTEQRIGKQGLPNRTLTPAGTITRTEYDGLGQPLSEWVGTDDTPTTGFWSTTNLAGTDMVKLVDYQYDQGGVGDGNLTAVTEYTGDGTPDRVTKMWYDWRNRLVAEQSGISSNLHSGDAPSITINTYDNLDRVTKTQTYAAQASTDIHWFYPVITLANVWHIRPDFSSPTSMIASSYYIQKDGKNADIPLSHTPTVGDFNGDGQSDILWRENSGSSVVIWTLSQTASGLATVAGTFTGTMTAGFTPTTGDFNGDGTSDILWYQSGSTTTTVWLMKPDPAQGTIVLSTTAILQNGSPVAVPTGSTPFVGDFNGDRQSDVLWRQTNGSDSVFWTLAKTTTGLPTLATNPFSYPNAAVGYKPTIGDFNGDGLSDVQWYLPGNTTTYVWLMKQDPLTGTNLLITPSNLDLQAGGPALVPTGSNPYVGDFNGDGISDIIWRQSNGTDTVFWLITPSSTGLPSVTATVTNSSSVNGYLPYIGDFNGEDGVAPKITDGELVLATNAATRLRSQMIYRYDDSGQVYQVEDYGVNQLTGVITSTPTITKGWFGIRGELVKTQSPNGLVEKTQYNGLGEPTAMYVTDGGGDTTYADALTVTGDTVFQQIDPNFDADGRVIQVTARDRVFGELGTGTLGTPTTGVKARVTYAGSYYDVGGRLLGEVDVGTNGGAVWTRPTTLPTRSDNEHVTTYSYGLDGLPNQVIGADGVSYQSIYDALGRTTSETAAASSTPDALTTTYAFDSGGRLASVTEPGARTTTYAYDTFERVSSVTERSGTPLARISKIAYNNLGDVTSTTDPIGTKSTINYNPLGQAISMTSAAGTPLARTGRMQYDALGRTISTTDPRGNTTRYSFDDVGRKATTTDALGNATTAAYDLDGRMISVTDANGKAWTTAYDLQGRTVSSSDPLGNIVSYQYLVNGDTMKVIDPRSNASTATMDRFGRTATAKDALGNTASMTYDRMDRVLTVTDPRGTPTNYGYDALGRVRTVTEAFGTTDQRVSSFTFDTVGDLASTTNPRGIVTKYTRDTAGRATGVTAAFGTTAALSVSTEYDLLDRTTKTTRPGSRVSTTEYDVLSQVTKMNDGVGTTLARSTSYNYDAAGNLITVTDPLNHVTTFGYNSRNERTSITDALGGVTAFVFDKVGNLVSLTDPVSNTTTWTYDDARRMTKFTDPRGKSKLYGYDKNSNVISITDRLGRKREFTFDANNRVTAETWKNTSNLTVQTQGFSYDANGNLLTATDPDGSYTFTFDKLNRVATTVQPFSVNQTFTYDKNSNRLTATDNKGGTLTSTYDNLDRLTSRVLVATGGTSMKADWAYDTKGDMVSVTRSGKSGSLWTTAGVTKYAYDDLGRTTNIKLTKGTTTTALSEYGYTFDAADRITKISINGVNRSYGYDNTDQVTSDNGTALAYDKNGNRTGGGYVTAGNNRMTNDGVWTYTYDDEGQMIGKSKSGEVWSYEYDFRGQMTKASKTGTTVTYKYDAFGNRIERSLNGTAERFVVDGWDTAKPGAVGTENFDVVMDLNSTNAVTMRRLFGGEFDEVVGRQTSTGVVNWYGTDHLGSVRQVFDNSGSVTNTVEYDAFGGFLGGVPVDRYAYTGREYDATTGQTHYRARVKDGHRFTSEDPMGFGAGDANLARYTRNRPISSRDPSGHYSLPGMMADLATKNPEMYALLVTLLDVEGWSIVTSRDNDTGRVNSSWGHGWRAAGDSEISTDATRRSWLHEQNALGQQAFGDDDDWQINLTTKTIVIDAYWNGPAASRMIEALQAIIQHEAEEESRKEDLNKYLDRVRRPGEGFGTGSSNQCASDLTKSQADAFKEVPFQIRALIQHMADEVAVSTLAPYGVRGVLWMLKQGFTFVKKGAKIVIKIPEKYRNPKYKFPETNKTTQCAKPTNSDRTPAIRRAPAPDNYRGRYMADRHSQGRPRLPDDWDVHHRIPQKYKDHPDFKDFDFHQPSNLKGVKGNRTDMNTHQRITNEWEEFGRQNPNATKVQIEDFANQLDTKYANDWFN